MHREPSSSEESGSSEAPTQKYSKDSIRSTSGSSEAETHPLFHEMWADFTLINSLSVGMLV